MTTIKSVWVKGCGPLNDVKIEFNSPVTVIGGANGSGKTRLLEAIFQMAQLMHGVEQNLNSAVEASLVLKIQGEECKEWQFTQGFNQLANDMPDHLPYACPAVAPKLIYFNSWPSSRGCRLANLRSGTIWEAFPISTKEYPFLSPYVLANKLTNSSCLDPVLSAGEGSLIAILGGLRRHLTPGAIVLIDDIETNLYPTYQQYLAEGLAALMDETPFQLIFTTHSLNFVHAFGAKNAILLDNFNK